MSKEGQKRIEGEKDGQTWTKRGRKATERGASGGEKEEKTERNEWQEGKDGAGE